MLRSIATKNFKKLHDHSFELTSGLNIISGENAQGKTTMTQAIMTALYGVRSVPGASENIPTWGEKDFEVTLEIGAYTIIRSLRNCKVLEQSALMATGHTACNDYIEDHITGADLKTFKLLNWSEQGETSALLTLGATQLQRDVEKLSGVAFIDDIIKLAGIDLRDFQRDVEGFESKGSKKELEGKLETIMTDRTAVMMGQSESETTKKALKAHQTEVKAQLSQMEGNNRLVVKIEKEVIKLQAQVDRHSESLSELAAEEKQLETKLSRLDVIDVVEFQNQKVRLVADRKTYELQQAAVRKKAEMEQLLNGFEELVAVDNELINYVKITEADLQTARDKVSSTENDCDRWVAEVLQLTKTVKSGRCETCGQLIADEAGIIEHEKLLVKAKATLSTLQDKQDVNVKALKSSEERLRDAKEAKEQNFGSWAVKAEFWHDSLDKANEMLSRPLIAEGYLENMQDRLDAEALQIREVDNVNDRLDLLGRKIQMAGKLLSANSVSLEEAKTGCPTSYSDTEVADLKADIQEITDDISNIVTHIHNLTIELATVTELCKQTSEALAAEVEHRETMNEIQLLTELIDYLRNSRVTFLSSIWSQILGHASGFLAQATDGKITGLSKSEKYGFMFCEDGQFAPVTSASGAQRGFIGVAARIGLSQALRVSCPVLVLDEPTESMSEANALRLSGALLSHGQIIVITHRMSDSYTASNVIEL